jgi:hypothetical protein
MQPTDVPFTVWFPLELINEAMIVAMERVGLEPDPNNLPTDGYIYIAAILKDDLHDMMLAKRRAHAADIVKQSIEQANVQADEDLAALERLRIEPATTP